MHYMDIGVQWVNGIVRKNLLTPPVKINILVVGSHRKYIQNREVCI